MLIYGKNTVREVLRFSPHLVKKVFFSQRREDLLPAIGRTPAEQRDKAYFEQSFPGLRHQGIAAEIASPPLHDTGYLEEVMAPSSLFLLLDGIQDPMNLGSILRTAFGMQVDAVVLTADRTAEVTPAVFSASSGYAGAVPLVRMKNPANAVKQLKKKGLWIAAAHMHGDAEIGDPSFAPAFPLLLCMGSEGSGVRMTFIKEADFSVRIPQREDFDSYNVSVAAAILLWELNRLR